MKTDRLLPYLTAILLGFFITLSSCTDDEGLSSSPDAGEFGIFAAIDDNTAELDGIINSASLRDFNAMISAYPDINEIRIINCDGSEDDEINLQLSRLVHQRNTAIHLVEEGLIASGGTDFFLAGSTRTKGNNTRIGVHSWSREDDNGNEVEATDFPEGHEFHLPYINYYTSVGFTQQQAEDFYYFTINAAPADGIHWMTDQEIAQYEMLTP